MLLGEGAISLVKRDDALPCGVVWVQAVNDIGETRRGPCRKEQPVMVAQHSTLRGTTEAG